MRVLLICTVYPPENAPAGIMIQELAHDMRAAGHQVRVLTGWPNHPEGKLFPGFRRRLRSHTVAEHGEVQRVWHTLPGHKTPFERILYWLTFSVSSCMAILLGPKPDVIYAHTAPLMGPLMTYVVSRLRGARYVYGIFDIYPEAALEAKAVGPGLVFRVARKIDGWVCKKAARVRVIGQGQKDTLLRRGIPADQVQVIPLWLDETRIRPTHRSSHWRTENGIGQDRLVVLYAGTIGLISGAGIVLDVALRFRDRPEVLFLFVGEGKIKTQLTQRCTELNLKNIQFLPFQPEERLNEVFCSADIGVVTLLPGAGRNSVPSKVLGYLAAGLPVVASVDSDSDIAEYLREGPCGRVCQPQDAGALERAIAELLDPAERKKAGAAARACFDHHFARSSGTRECTRLLEQASI